MKFEGSGWPSCIHEVDIPSRSGGERTPRVPLPFLCPACLLCLLKLFSSWPIWTCCRWTIKASFYALHSIKQITFQRGTEGSLVDGWNALNSTANRQQRTTGTRGVLRGPCGPKKISKASSVVHFPIFPHRIFLSSHPLLLPHPDVTLERSLAEPSLAAALYSLHSIHALICPASCVLHECKIYNHLLNTL